MTVDKAPVSIPAVVPPFPQSSQGTRALQRRASQRISKQPQAKSPIKSFKVGKSNRRKAVTAAQIRDSLPSPKEKKVIPSFETEVIPVPVPTITLSRSQAEGTGKLNTKSASLLASSFVLPPPSPEASLPRYPMDLGQPIPPPQFLAPPNLTPSNLPKLPDFYDLKTSDDFSSHIPLESQDMDEDQEMASLGRFPVAKPLAQRMAHAYSPIKPSPLSRVLVAAGSPDSSSSHHSDVPFAQYRGALMTLREEDDSRLEQKHEPFPPTADREDEEMSLAQQLGIPDSPPESAALKRKRVDSSGSNEDSRRKHKSSVRSSQTNVKTTSKGRILVRDSHPISTAKGKAKAGSSGRGQEPEQNRRSTRSVSTSGPSSSKAVETNAASQIEKENKRDQSGKRSAGLKTSSSKGVGAKDSTTSSGAAKMKQSTSSQAPTTNALSTRSRLLAKLPPSSRGVSGPKRILVESIEK